MSTISESPGGATKLPITNTSAIPWRDWDEQAFGAARSEGKPVLLALTATWCHWCHVMDQTSYSDLRVIEMVNEWFIPVRVDVDQRPDLSARYNQGGFPSVAFLNADGQLIAGRLYTEPEEMVGLLESIRHSYSDGSWSDNSYSDFAGNSLSENERSGLVRQRLEELYDTRFGGFGDEPKQPPWEGVEFLLSLYQQHGESNIREMVSRTLDHIVDGLFDRRDGGFFRYSVSRDWRVPHYEKMLYTNARLASTLMLAFQVTGKTSYKNAALGTFDYLVTNLRDQSSGMFWASQDAREEYYRLPWKDRNTEAKPFVDTTIYTGWNASVATALIHAYGVFRDESFLKQALLVLDTLWAEFDGDRGLSHVVKEPAGRPRFLSDHVHALSAFLNCYQTTGNHDHLERAKAVLNSINQLFSAPDCGFFDVTSKIVSGGPPLVGVKPVLENALVAEALVTLATITLDDAYLDVANATLNAFTGVVPGISYLGPPSLRKVEEDEERLFSPAASAWARAKDTMDSGQVHLVVLGDTSRSATQALVRASLRAKTLRWVVQILDPTNDSDKVKSLGFPTTDSPAIYLCVGKQCLAPIRSPGELRRWTRPGALASLAA